MNVGTVYQDRKGESHMVMTNRPVTRVVINLLDGYVELYDEYGNKTTFSTERLLFIETTEETIEDTIRFSQIETNGAEPGDD